VPVALLYLTSSVNEIPAVSSAAYLVKENLELEIKLVLFID
jgi:hypothetical protein